MNSNHSRASSLFLPCNKCSLLHCGDRFLGRGGMARALEVSTNPQKLLPKRTHWNEKFRTCTFSLFSLCFFPLTSTCWSSGNKGKGAEITLPFKPRHSLRGYCHRGLLLDPKCLQPYHNKIQYVLVIMTYFSHYWDTLIHHEKKLFVKWHAIFVVGFWPITPT